MVLELIRRVRDKGLPVMLISHNMPHVFEIADRIHIARLGKRAAVREPEEDQHERHGGGDDRARCGRSEHARPSAWRIECRRDAHQDGHRRATPRADGDAASSCARAARARAACASTTSASCCRRSACTARCPAPRSRALTQLTAQTVSLITKRLLDDGLLRQARAACAARSASRRCRSRSTPTARSRSASRSAGAAWTCCWSTSPARCASAGRSTTASPTRTRCCAEIGLRLKRAAPQARSRRSASRVQGVGIAAPLSLGGWQHAARHAAASWPSKWQRIDLRARGRRADRPAGRAAEGHRRGLRRRAGGRPRAQREELPVRVRRHLHRRRAGASTATCAAALHGNAGAVGSLPLGLARPGATRRRRSC